MPTFCRHNRLESTCPICARQKGHKEQAPAGRSPSRPGAAQRRAASGSPRRRSSSGDMRVRRLTRAVEDGFASPLVPGLHASADAELLAEELAFAAARLQQLREQPPGLYERARQLGGEEGLWLAFQVAYFGPLEDERPFAEIERVQVSWADGELPRLTELRGGPRGAWEPARGTDTLAAYRAWAARGGSQAKALEGEPGWIPERRFERAFERLALPGLTRAARYEFLLSAGELGLAELQAASLHLLADPRDPTVSAAKRVFGIGDVLLVQRRAGELLAATGVPIAALDLGLLNWARRTDTAPGGRITAGAEVEPDTALRASVRAALGLTDAPQPADASQQGAEAP